MGLIDKVGDFAGDKISGIASNFGSQLGDQLSGFAGGVAQGFFGADDLKDYTHASKTFVSDGYALAPTNKFLFHVYFNLNTAGIPGLSKIMGSPVEKATLGMLVKTITLPSFDIEVDEVNQYNRKRYIQKKIEYKPVQITMHDDGSDKIRSMWYNYYNYYYHDSGSRYEPGSGGQAYTARDMYDNHQVETDWGYNGQGPNNAIGGGDVKPHFFQDITVYGFNRGNFVQYTLVNPSITSWEHDTYDYSAGGEVMQHTMSMVYETVKYSRGKIGEGVMGYQDPAMYDTSPSKLSKPGSTASLFGQGGLADAGAGIYEDLANGDILGAIQKSGSVYETFKNANLSEVISTDLVNEGITQGLSMLKGPGISNAVSNFSFGGSMPDVLKSAKLPVTPQTPQLKNFFGSSAIKDYKLGGMSMASLQGNIPSEWPSMDGDLTQSLGNMNAGGDQAWTNADGSKMTDAEIKASQSQYF
jgi:hypothetical protein